MYYDKKIKKIQSGFPNGQTLRNHPNIPLRYFRTLFNHKVCLEQITHKNIFKCDNNDTMICKFVFHPNLLFAIFVLHTHHQ
jgi:hypothetical protein